MIAFHSFSPTMVMTHQHVLSWRLSLHKFDYPVDERVFGPGENKPGRSARDQQKFHRVPHVFDDLTDKFISRHQEAFRQQSDIRRIQRNFSTFIWEQSRCMKT